MAVVFLRATVPAGGGLDRNLVGMSLALSVVGSGIVVVVFCVIIGFWVSTKPKSVALLMG